MSKKLTTTSTELVDRNNLGQFVKGVSGNPAGKPRGAKNRVLIMKQAMEEALTRNVSEDFLAILQVAIDLAKTGDKDMIKLVLGDFMKEARRADTGDGDDGGPKRVEISISQYFGPGGTEATEAAIDAQFEEIKADHVGRTKPT